MWTNTILDILGTLCYRNSVYVQTVINHEDINALTEWHTPTTCICIYCIYNFFKLLLCKASQCQTWEITDALKLPTGSKMIMLLLCINIMKPSHKISINNIFTKWFVKAYRTMHILQCVYYMMVSCYFCNFYTIFTLPQL
jgi:hypothetical protein